METAKCKVIARDWEQGERLIGRTQRIIRTMKILGMIS